MKIFLRFWKNVPVFQSLLYLPVIVMNVSMERLSGAKFAPVFYEA